MLPVSPYILPFKHVESGRRFNYYNSYISSGHQIILKFFILLISMSSMLILRKKTFIFFNKCRKSRKINCPMTVILDVPKSVKG